MSAKFIHLDDSTFVAIDEADYSPCIQHVVDVAMALNLPIDDLRLPPNLVSGINEYRWGNSIVYKLLRWIRGGGRG